MKTKIKKTAQEILKYANRDLLKYNKKIIRFLPFYVWYQKMKNTCRLEITETLTDGDKIDTQRDVNGFSFIGEQLFVHTEDGNDFELDKISEEESSSFLGFLEEILAALKQGTLEIMENGYIVAKPELKKWLKERIIGLIYTISGNGALDIEEFSANCPHVTGCQVLIETNHQEKKQETSTVNMVIVNRFGYFHVLTDNGPKSSQDMTTLELRSLYRLLKYVEKNINNPDWEFHIESSTIKLNLN